MLLYLLPSYHVASIRFHPKTYLFLPILLCLDEEKPRLW